MAQLRSAAPRGVLAKILALTAAVTIFAVLAGVGVARRVADDEYQQAGAQLAATYQEWLQQDLVNQELRAAQLATQASRDPDAVAAIAARDRAALLALTKPGFDELKKSYGIAQYQWHLVPATSFLRVHKPEQFGDDLSAFRATVVEANQTKKLVSSPEGGVAGLGVRAVAPVFADGKHLGSVEFGTSLGQAYVERISRDFHAKAGLFAPGAKDPKLAPVFTTFGEAFAPSGDLLDAAGKGTQGSQEASIGGTTNLVLYLPVKDHKDATIAVVVLAKDVSALAAARDSGQRLGLLAGLGILVAALGLGGLVAWRIGCSVTRPVARIGTVLQTVSTGDLTVRAPATGDRVVQRLATHVNATLDSLEEALRRVGVAATHLSASCTELDRSASSMAETVHTVVTQADQIQASATEVTESVNMAAAGTEEMNASIREIASTTSRAADIGSEAVTQTQQTSAQMAALSQTTTEISHVIKVITGIAEQTNLLALNATIEAARAGEAGKGFAVVASEVKELAQGTGEATEEVTGRVQDIQREATRAVSAIESIGAVIDQVNEYQTSISSAVEEQTATTAEMSRSVAHAAQGMATVSAGATGLLGVAQQAQHAVERSREASERTAALSHDLDTLVAGFRFRDR